MAEELRFTLVTYDIVDDRRRLKVAKIMEDFGERVQYSVFECFLTRRQRELLIRRLKGVINQEEDSVRIYDLGSLDPMDIEVIGSGKVPEEPADYEVI